MEGLQTIVDTLAGELKRGVAIDDRRLRLIVHSPHYGSIDAIRRESILTRAVSTPVHEWVYSFGVAEAEGPVRLRPDRPLGAEARICCPIRCQGTHLGYLFVMDPDQSLTDDDLTLCREASDAAGTILYRERLLQEIERSREREVIRDLLSDDPRLQQRSASIIGADGMLGDSRRGAVISLRIVDEATNTDVGGLEMTLAMIEARTRRKMPGRSTLGLVHPDHAILLVAERPDMPVETVGATALRLAEEVIDSEMPGSTAVVGIGGVADLWDCRTSYRQSLQALRVAELVPHFKRLAGWSELGVYQTLSQFPLDRMGQSLHPGLAILFDDSSHGDLVKTLETYLDLAGDAKSAAEALAIHRASLYYRLHKIEEIASVDLKDGYDRLALHVGLKLVRLAGSPTRQPRSSDPTIVARTDPALREL